MEAGDSGEEAKGQGRSDFGSENVAAATGIRLVRREQGKVGGGEHGQRRVGER